MRPTIQGIARQEARAHLRRFYAATPTRSDVTFAVMVWAIVALCFVVMVW